MITESVSQDFIHLCVHTSYSLLEGSMIIKELPALCHKYNMPALGISDTNNMFGVYEFSMTMAEAGIQPIIGTRIHVTDNSNSLQNEISELPLIAKNKTGYRNLMKISSTAFLRSRNENVPTVMFNDITMHNEGMICICGGVKSKVSKLLMSGKYHEAVHLVQYLKNHFDDRLYIGIHRHGSGGQFLTLNEHKTEEALLGIANKLRVPIVAINDVLFVDRSMHEAYKVISCIASNGYMSTYETDVTPEHYFKSQKEMKEVYQDIPEAIESTIEIAKRCTFMLQPSAPRLPVFMANETEMFAKQATDGLQERMRNMHLSATKDAYYARLDYEISVILNIGFAGYFLIVADFIQWAKNRNIPVGPGRGSGAGSLVAFALRITDIDPLRFNLLFERFLNPDRVSMPDFDVDFCPNQRDEVLRYVQQRYGKYNVCQIITFGKLQARAALRDVGRVLQIPYSQVDKVCRTLVSSPTNPVTLEQAYAEQPQFMKMINAIEDGIKLFDISSKVEGLYRHASTHAAGVVISDQPLECIVPLYKDFRSDMPVTQLDMKSIEASGLVKFDFLGLKTLTIINMTVKAVKSSKGININILDIDLSDEEVFLLYSKAETTGIFQVESPGMREALRKLRPTCIEDIIALVALYRPGPMENIEKYCNIKHGKEKVSYIHPVLQDILEETQGIIVYQEQVMQIVQAVAGYSLSQADIMRRVMGKKDQAGMDKQRDIFVHKAMENGITKTKAIEISELLVKFANYGFNKSHAAAYAIISYQTAWLKAHYPLEFVTELMNVDIDNTDRLAVIYNELRRMRISVMAPDVNNPYIRFSTVSGGMIAFGLASLKNVGEEAIRVIVDSFKAGGAFLSIDDFMMRVNLKKVGKRALESLIKAGALDSIENNRKFMLRYVDVLIRYSAIHFEELCSPQDTLFADSRSVLLTWSISHEDHRNDFWDQDEKLREEYSAVGFFLSAHPLDALMAECRKKNLMTYSDLIKKADGITRGSYVAKLIAYVIDVREEEANRKGTRGMLDNRRLLFRLSDPGNEYVCSVYSNAFTPDFSASVGDVLVMTAELVKNNEGDTGILRVREINKYKVNDQDLNSINHENSGAKHIVRIKINRRVGLIRELHDLFTHVRVARQSELDNCSQMNVLLVITSDSNDDRGQELKIMLPQHITCEEDVLKHISLLSGVLQVQQELLR